MLFLKKMYHNLALRCFAAVTAGIVAITFITLELAKIGLEEEHPVDMADMQTLRFPETEESLRAMSARLVQDLNAAAIEPAAGD